MKSLLDGTPSALYAQVIHFLRFLGHRFSFEIRAMVLLANYQFLKRVA